jgi:hypothetical protein
MGFFTVAARGHRPRFSAMLTSMESLKRVYGAVIARNHGAVNI